MFKYFKQRGQVLLLYALLIPLLLLFVGVGLDLGWYYLNVSRLQNAANAAALAGAQELVARNNTLKGYKITLVDNKFAGYPEPDEDISTAEGDEVAADYVRRNLSSDDKATALTNEAGTYAYTVTDNWSPNSSEVTMTPHLGYNDEVFYYVVYLTEDIRHFLMPGRYEPIPAPVVAVATISKEENDIGEEQHGLSLFDQLWLSDRGGMVIEARGEDGNLKTDSGMEVRDMNGNVAQNTVGIQKVITDYKNDGISQETLDANGWTVKEIKSKVMQNWELQDQFKGNAAKYKEITQFNNAEGKTIYTADGEKWNHFQYQKGGKKISYDGTSKYRYEKIDVQPTGGSNVTTSANGGKIRSEEEVDSINIDFSQDVEFSSSTFKKDWDIGAWDSSYKTVEGVTVSPVTAAKDGWGDWKDGKRVAFDLRIHSTINFNKAYKVREGKGQDILWARIESEPIYNKILKADGTFKSMTQLNSVRELIININQSNTAEDYRPVIIMYDGPEKMEPESDVRVSQPVILNLKADWRGGIYAPNSPVVVIGNGHKLEGFVVANEFLRLATEEDFQGKWFDENGKEHNFYTIDGDTITDNEDSTKVYYKITNAQSELDMIVDANGNVQTRALFNPADFMQYGDKIWSYDLPDHTISNSNYRDNYYTEVREGNGVYNILYYDLSEEHGTGLTYKITNRAGGDCTKQILSEALANRTYSITSATWNSGEMIYKVTCPYINLSASSFYSTFEDEDLKRTNYETLDSNNTSDLLFTTKRAQTVD